MNERWEFFQDKQNKFRWRKRTANGKIVAASTQGYSRKADAVKNAVKHGYETHG